jgi:APA family basic amino acid/polyamine antiporter
VLVFRRREPETPRPYHAPGYPVIPWVLVLGSVGFLVGAVVGDPLNSRWALALLGLSYPAFRWTRGNPARRSTGTGSGAGE